MANKTTVALTREQFEEIIETMYTGGAGFRPNPQIATALILEANLGLRIGDILKLKLTSFIKDGGRYRLKIVEEKTKKKRPFTVPDDVYRFVVDYCSQRNIQPYEPIFKTGVRNVENYLSKVVDYLGLGEDISTHSFRKYFGTDILEKNKYNYILVQRIYQHSSPAITQRYLGIQSEEMELALSNHVVLPQLK